MSDKIKTIRGHVEIHAETHWVPREDDEGVLELVVDAWRVEHRDGSVEFAGSAQEALALVTSFHERARRKVERKDPAAKVMWVTSIHWHNVPVGFEVPTFEVKS